MAKFEVRLRVPSGTIAITVEAPELPNPEQQGASTEFIQLGDWFRLSEILAVTPLPPERPLLPSETVRTRHG